MNAEGSQMNAVTPFLGVNAITGKVIGAAYRVSSSLGTGFLEKVYENALAVELRRGGIALEQQKGVLVRYFDEVVGEYVPDLLVEGSIIVEIKSMPCLERAHRMQCINYLRATDLHLALLLNFGRPRLEIARIVLNL